MPRSDTPARTAAAFTALLESIAPWLLELGNWIYGGLIASTLVLLGVLLTVGPVDPAVKVASAAFALALPLDITGFVLLRLFADFAKSGIAEMSTKAMIDAGFTVEGGPPTFASSKVRSVALRYSYRVLFIAVLLTLVGLTAAFWHMAWWIGLIFLVSVVVSPIILMAAIGAIGPAGRWRTAAGEVEPPKTT
jgi:predicted RND superfamily exporter protein